MPGLRKRGEDIRLFILENVERHPKDIVTFTSAALGISRQAVSKHIQHLIAKEALVAEGATRNRRYTIRPIATKVFTYSLQGLRENAVWRNDVAPKLSGLPDNVRDIWQYGFTEILNNAIDHSSGNTVEIMITRTPIRSDIIIYDDGEGIFTKIQRELNLDDERHAVLELAKGKLTTDPVHHTGEGIFFSSRMFDGFGIDSGKTSFSHSHKGDLDWITEESKPKAGTWVIMILKNNPAKQLRRYLIVSPLRTTIMGSRRRLCPCDWHNMETKS